VDIRDVSCYFRSYSLRALTVGSSVMIHGLAAGSAAPRSARPGGVALDGLRTKPRYSEDKKAVLFFNTMTEHRYRWN
jgi:hypothetical protein